MQPHNMTRSEVEYAGKYFNEVAQKAEQIVSSIQLVINALRSEASHMDSVIIPVYKDLEYFIDNQLRKIPNVKERSQFEEIFKLLTKEKDDINRNLFEQRSNEQLREQFLNVRNMLHDISRDSMLLASQYNLPRSTSTV